MQQKPILSFTLYPLHPLPRLKIPTVTSISLHAQAESARLKKNVRCIQSVVSSTSEGSSSGSKCSSSSDSKCSSSGWVHQRTLTPLGTKKGEKRERRLWRGKKNVGPSKPFLIKIGARERKKKKLFSLLMSRHGDSFNCFISWKI